MNILNISKKIPNSPLRIILFLIMVAGGSIGFRLLMEHGLLVTIWGKALFLIILLMIFLILFAVERKYLLRKTAMTPEQICLLRFSYNPVPWLQKI